MQDDWRRTGCPADAPGDCRQKIPVCYCIYEFRGCKTVRILKMRKHKPDSPAPRAGESGIRIIGKRTMRIVSVRCMSDFYPSVGQTDSVSQRDR